MKNNIEELLKIKEQLQEDDNLYIETRNKEKGCIGCASFQIKAERISVWEGNPDGSDDADYTYEEFIQKYDYRIKNEKEKEELEEFNKYWGLVK